MGNGEGLNIGKKKLSELFRDFMTSIAKFEELVNTGSSLLVGFQQALGFIGRPPTDKTSPLVDQLMAHNVRKLHKCHLELQNHIKEAKSVVDALKYLVDEFSTVLQDVVNNSALDSSVDGDEQVCISDHLKPRVVDYGVLMAIIYSMMRQDYTMQDLIVSSLNLNSSPGELQTYCQMWLLRPYIDDDIMHTAWSLVQ